MPPRGFSSLERLAQEMLDNILFYLEQSRDRLNLSLTSKRLREATSRTLYEEITMTWRADQYDDRGSGPRDVEQRDAPRIDLLLRTLIDNPSLCEDVKSINLQTRDFRHTGTHYAPPQAHLTDPSPFNASHAAFIKDFLRRTDPRGAVLHDKLIQGLSSNDMDSIVVLVLMLCPNVISLTMDINIFRQNILIEKLLKYALPGNHKKVFRHLRHLKLGTTLFEDERLLDYHNNRSWVEVDEELDLLAYLPIFYVDGLQEATICLPGLWNEMKFAWPKNTPPKLLSLTKLQLLDSSLDAAALHHIFDATPNLTTFHYDYWYDGTPLDAKALSDALGILKDTLVHLKIGMEHTREEDGSFYPRPFSERIIGHCSVKHMTNLQTLLIPPVVLFGWSISGAPPLTDILPPQRLSLEVSGQAYERPGEYEWVGECLGPRFRDLLLLRSEASAFSNLRELTIESQEWDGADAMRDLCRQLDIACIIAPWKAKFDLQDGEIIGS